MRRAPIFVVAGVLGLSLAATAGAQQTRHQAQYCGSLAAFHADAAAFNNLGQEATVGETKAMAKRVRDDADNIQNAAGEMKTPAAKQFKDAANKLKEDYNSIPDNVTVQQAHEEFQGDISSLKAAAQQLAVESGCPQMAQPGTP